MICVSVCAQTAVEMIAKIKSAVPLADVIEVRFDCLQSSELDQALNKTRIWHEQNSAKLLATLRTKEQGGKRDILQEERIKFWSAGNGTVFWGGDLEEDIIERSLDCLWFERICSCHDISERTSNVKEIFDRLIDTKATVIKIAVTTSTITDAIPLWNLLNRACSERKQFIPIAMGEAGKWTRILGLAHGAYMTYAALGEGEKTADGQITARDMIEVYRVKELDKDTAVYGVIGDPVSSSLSPYLHNAGFAAGAINAVFLPLLVQNLDEFIRRMVARTTREVELNFAGFSVTMPHKRSIMRHLDAIDAVAERIGAVNTVRIEQGKLIGYNTDAHGFIAPLKAKFGDVKDARVAVIGAGGAARACVYALENEGADITVLSRDLRKAETLADEFRVKSEQLTADHGPLATDIVVNATPLGMKGPLENRSPLTSEQLKGVKSVYDLVTRSGVTPFVADAEKCGAKTIDGLEMLISQGLRQFEIWTGREAPDSVMRHAVMARLNQMI
jgi:3-dehydroquinate dehydratase/shikimate dehydrogenase